MWKQGILTVLLIGLIGSQSFGADFQVYKTNDKERASLSNSKPVEFFYEKSSWDTKITELDEGSLFLRDQASGEVYELKLVETEPNSSVFSLKMPPGKLKTPEVGVEIYSVPNQMLNGKKHLEVVSTLLKKRALKRKPFLLRVLRKEGQLIDVFDTKEDALASYQRFKTTMGIKANDDIKPSNSIIEVSKSRQPENKKVIDTSTLQSLFLANEAGTESQQLKNSELRDVLRKIELKRRNAVVSNGNTFAPAKVKSNELKGKKNMKKGLTETKAKNYEAAQTFLYTASDQVPHSENLYMQYGLSLHRNGKYNQSIVVLELAKPASSKATTTNFYLGLNYYKLKDWPNAEQYFQKVKKSDDKELAPTAAFYLGNTQLELKKFEDSKDSFQYVLDNSKDPKMDRRAEQYIEYGLKQKSLEKKRSHKWFADGLFGLIYDSNVILALDNDDQLETNTGQPEINTNQEGLRLITSNSLKYRPFYSEKNEIAIRGDFTLLQTQDLDLSSNDELKKADPIVVSVGVPWTHRGVLWSRGYAFDLTPRYESIFMDLEGNGKENIIKSLVLDFNNTLVINPRFVARANYQIRQDDADIGGSNAADAIKFVADFSSIIVLNSDAERFLIPALAWSMNDAQGDAFAYTRIDAGITFTNSVFEKFIWTNKLGYFLSNYKNGRTDNNYAATSGLGYSLGPHWTAGLNLNYQVNNSNTNPYRKFQGMTTFSYSY